VARVNGSKTPPKEDTLPETPSAKASDPRIPIPDEWRAPLRRKPSGQGTDLAKGDRAVPFETGGARLDLRLGSARFHTISVRGPLAFLLGIGTFVIVGLIVALVVVFAVGLGAALALGGALLAALGMGTAALRRRLSGSRRSTLDGGSGEP
jgi:hypothetical protein